MKIKAMLARLQAALGQPHLIEQMVLSSGSESLETAETRSERAVNLVIGYNGSPNSQVALDLTLWIAHQTRLATQKQVMVHVVYVVDQAPTSTKLTKRGRSARRRDYSVPLQTQAVHVSRSATVNPLQHPTVLLSRKDNEVHALTESRETLETCLNLCHLGSVSQSTSLLEQADCILWQARCLAEEWRGSLEAHLRFGSVTAELRRVVQEEQADLLLLGCSAADHPLVNQLAVNFPCPILGIPVQLEDA